MFYYVLKPENLLMALNAKNWLTEIITIRIKAYVDSCLERI